MKQIERISKITMTVIMLLLGFPSLAHGQATDSTVDLDLPPQSGLKGLTDNAYGTFTNIFNLTFTIAISLTLLALVANGIRYIVAFGNEEQIEKAKHGFYYSILGFVILLLAFTIVATVNFILTRQK